MAKMSETDNWITTGEVCRRTGAAAHQARRVIDALEQAGRVRVFRAASYRLIRRTDIKLVQAELLARGWLREKSSAGTAAE